MKNLKEDLMFSHMGNGVTVCDKNREKNNDYLTVAHISYDRTVSFNTKKLSEESKMKIESFAKNENMTVSAAQQDCYALCPLK